MIQSLANKIKVFMVALTLLALPYYTEAGSASLGFQFTVSPAGPLDHWWYWCLYDSPGTSLDFGGGTNGIQCVNVPGTITGVSGVSTVKPPRTEILAYIFCGGKILWQGEHFQGSVPIQASGLGEAGITGPCYIGIQSLTDGTYPGGYELNAVIYYKP